MGKRQLVLIFGIILLVVSIYFFYLMVYRQETEPKSDECVTDKGPILYELEEQLSILKKYEEMCKAMACNVLEEGCGMISLPGLGATRTLSSNKSAPIRICTSMTPQGLCVTEKYLLVSAYCHVHNHNSVIYVIDKYTKEFVKEIVLQGKKHVGGLAYDPVHHMIWISAGSGKGGEVAAFSIETLLSYNLDKELAPVEYEKKYELYTLERDSFITYDRGYLYAGHFSMSKESVLQKFKIDDEGGLIVGPGIDFGIKKMIPIPEDIQQIPERTQGIAICEDKMILSQSYGWSSSKLYIYKYGETVPVKKINMPQKMEQIYVDGDYLYVLFESAAYAYRAQPLSKVDRICKLRLDDIFEMAEQHFQYLREG